jgi:hypothetical protein
MSRALQHDSFHAFYRWLFGRYYWRYWTLIVLGILVQIFLR